jgi:hypothetical protein
VAGFCISGLGFTVVGGKDSAPNWHHFPISPSLMPKIESIACTLCEEMAFCQAAASGSFVKVMSMSGPEVKDSAIVDGPMRPPTWRYLVQNK